MAIMSIKDKFRLYEDEFLKFDRVINKRHHIPLIHALLLLTELFPEKKYIFNGIADDDIVYLYFDLTGLSDDLLIELMRCGIDYDEVYEQVFIYV